MEKFKLLKGSLIRECNCHHYPACQQDNFDPSNCHILAITIEYLSCKTIHSRMKRVKQILRDLESHQRLKGYLAELEVKEELK